jgi:arylsulfatase A-like enzyme
MNHKTIIKALVLALIVFTIGCTQTQKKETVKTPEGKEFKGVIKLDVRESTADWAPFMLKKAPEGSPNILFILYDDTGLAAWSPYGGAINMPTLDKLAANGLTYTQWHTVALCSPTRSCILTGRNHNLNGFGSITEGANGFPGFNARIPQECATIGQVLQDNGWSTFWLGKDHNVPTSDLASGGSKSEWPLQKGFDRFYGFIGGETNQWYPDLVEDNHYIEPPYSPEEGYHFSKDLADQAIKMIGNQQSANPSKPWFMWFCPGANHANARRITSTSIKANSMKVMKLTGNGYFRA